MKLGQSLKTNKKLGSASGVMMRLQDILTEASAKEITAILNKKYPSRAADIDVVVGSGNPPATWPLIMRMVDGSGERAQEILSLVGTFNRLKHKLPKKDLGQYNDAQELRQAIESVSTAKSKTAAREEVKGQVEKIYEDDNFVVIYPHSKEASCVWGAGTTWCTAATQSANYFPYYSSAGNKLYYLITKGVDPKDDPKAKLSLGFGPDGKFSGGQDGGLSVDAKNKGITMSAVIDQLQTRSDDATTKQIISAIKTHAASSGDHPMKGFYERMLVDPSVHRSVFDDSLKSNSPEPYVTALTFADTSKTNGTYPNFTFDMCVYLNQLIKTFGPTNEAFQELEGADSVYRQSKLKFDPNTTDLAELDQYIQDALWLIEAFPFFMRPVVFNMNSVPNAIKALQTERLNSYLIQSMLQSNFLDDEAFLQAVRLAAIDPSLSIEQRTPFVYGLELLVRIPGNFEAWTEAVLFYNNEQSAAERYNAWMYQLRSSFDTREKPPSKLLARVIDNFIVPNIIEILSSPGMMSSTGTGGAGMVLTLTEYFDLDASEAEAARLFESVSGLYFLVKESGTAEKKRMYTAWDNLITFGIRFVSSVNFERLMQLIDESVTDRRPENRIDDIINCVNQNETQDPKLVVIMRRVAEMARQTYVPTTNSVPSYAVWWWRSNSIPPEYIPARDKISVETQGFGVPSPKLWPPPEPSTATLSELLFRR